MERLKEIYMRAVDLEALGISIAFITTDSEEEKAEAKRNARLIAAAPELLEVLKEAFDMIDGVLLIDVFGGEWFEKADEAIKKATGDQA